MGFGFAQIVYELCVTGGHGSFYISGGQKVFPFFHQNFHLKLLRCRCRNTKLYLPSIIASANGYNKKLERSVTEVMDPV